MKLFTFALFIHTFSANKLLNQNKPATRDYLPSGCVDEHLCSRTFDMQLKIKFPYVRDINKRRAAERKYTSNNRAAINERNKMRYLEITKDAREAKQKINATLPPLLVSNGIKPRKGKIVNCAQCNTEFYLNPSRNRKFCSQTCSFEYQRRNVKHTLCVICNKPFYCTPSQLLFRNRKTCSKKCHGKNLTRIAEERIRLNPNAVQNVNRSARYSTKAKDWRTAVFQRDNYTCQHCGARNGKGNKPVYLEAHHIKQFAFFPELRYELSNGITVCKPCHKKIPHIRKTKNHV